MRLLPVVLIAVLASPCAAEPLAEPAALDLASAEPIAAAPVAEARAAVRNAVKTDPRVAPVAASAPVKRSFDQRLTALDLALATIVAERPGVWRFEPLEQEATALLLEARNETDRQAVRAVAVRLDRFATIADRYRKNRSEAAAGWTSAGGANNAGDGQRLAPPVRLTKARGDAPLDRDPTGSGYDAVGVLRPVVSQRADAPKYAIVGDDGRLLTFVTPSDEVGKGFDDLLGKRIGVQGARGYLTDLRREHLTAQRVTPLGSRLR